MTIFFCWSSVCMYGKFSIYKFCCKTFAHVYGQQIFFHTHFFAANNILSTWRSLWNNLTLHTSKFYTLSNFAIWQLHIDTFVVCQHICVRKKLTSDCMQYEQIKLVIENLHVITKFAHLSRALISDIALAG